MLQFIIERANYWAIIGLMMVGLYIAFQSANLIKKLVGLSIFQTSVFLFYITLGKIAGGSAPILYGDDATSHGGGHSEEAGHGTAVVAGDHGADADIAALDVFQGEDLANATDTVQGADIGQSADIVQSADLAGHGADLASGGANPYTGLQEVYSNPLPHVLILTAIVVGVATLAVGLALVVRIREAYGSIEYDDIRETDIQTADAQDADDAAGAVA